MAGREEAQDRAHLWAHLPMLVLAAVPPNHSSRINSPVGWGVVGTHPHPSWAWDSFKECTPGIKMGLCRQGGSPPMMMALEEVLRLEKNLDILAVDLHRICLDGGGGCGQ